MGAIKQYLVRTTGQRKLAGKVETEPIVCQGKPVGRPRCRIFRFLKGGRISQKEKLSNREQKERWSEQNKGSKVPVTWARVEARGLLLLRFRVLCAFLSRLTGQAGERVFPFFFVSGFSEPTGGFVYRLSSSKACVRISHARFLIFFRF